MAPIPVTPTPDNDGSDVITGEVVSHDTARVGAAEYLPPRAAAALVRVPGAAFDPSERLVEAWAATAAAHANCTDQRCSASKRYLICVTL